ncbi:hypothetical protein C8J56DRAFT_495968 [Mycena floridula]|nr:hypothetical protein C8J56DRAFT_495968 [Mycena floridula]
MLLLCCGFAGIIDDEHGTGKSRGRDDWAIFWSRIGRWWSPISKTPRSDSKSTNLSTTASGDVLPTTFDLSSKLSHMLQFLVTSSPAITAIFAALYPPNIGEMTKVLLFFSLTVAAGTAIAHSIHYNVGCNRVLHAAILATV